MKFDDLVDAILKEDLRHAALAGLLGLGLTGGAMAAGGGSNIIKPATSQSVSKLPRGIRNNNPGNIEAGKDKWNGMIGSDGKFVHFKSAPHGLRAIGVILRNYKKKYNINTIEGIIKKWAPPNENNTESYIRNVEQNTGISRDQKLNLNDRDQLKKLINAIVMQENGKQYKYQDSVMNVALDLIFTS